MRIFFSRKKKLIFEHKKKYIRVRKYGIRAVNTNTLNTRVMITANIYTLYYKIYKT